MSDFRAKGSDTPSALLWLADGSSGISEKTLERGIQQLSPSESQRYSNFQRAERQRQYLLGRMLLRLATSSMLNVPRQAVSAIERPGKGPLLILPEGVQAPAFSLSHSRQWVACAISIDAQLGLDIEVVDMKRDVVALSQAAFYPDEQRFIKSQNDDLQLAAFYRIWTMKEALFKLTSNLSADKSLSSVVVTQDALRWQGDGWFCSAIAHPSLSISLCSDVALAKVIQVKVSELNQV